MKKLILTASLFFCFMLMFNITVQAVDNAMMMQDNQNGNPPPPPNGQGGPGKPGQDRPEGAPMYRPQARETITQRREDIKENRQEMISGMKEMREDMREKIGSKPGEMRDDRQELRMNMKEKMSSMSGKIKEMRKENMSDRCKLVTGRISKVTSAAYNGIGGRQKAFFAISERFKKLATNLEEKGADVTALNAAIVTLDEKIATLEADYQIFISKLEGTQEKECGNSQGEFKDATSDASTAFKQVQTDKEAIQSFLKTDMKAVLEALRASMPKPESTVAPEAEGPVNQ